MTDIADKIAPYPMDKPTAVGLIRHLTASAYRRTNVDFRRLHAQWRAAGMPNTGPIHDALEYSCNAASAEYGLAALLEEACEEWMIRDPGRLAQLVEEVHLPYAGETDSVVGRLEARLELLGIDLDALNVPQVDADATAPQPEASDEHQADEPTLDQPPAGEVAR